MTTSTRKIVTGHDPSGRAIVREDSHPAVEVAGGEAKLTLVWSTDCSPADHNDETEVRHLKAGYVVIQRGTNHAWVNPGPTWSRMALVLIDAEPVRIGDWVLPEIHP